MRVCEFFMFFIFVGIFYRDKRLCLVKNDYILVIYEIFLGTRARPNGSDLHDKTRHVFYIVNPSKKLYSFQDIESKAGG